MCKYYVFKKEFKNYLKLLCIDNLIKTGKIKIGIICFVTSMVFYLGKERLNLWKRKLVLKFV